MCFRQERECADSGLQEFSDLCWGDNQRWAFAGGRLRMFTHHDRGMALPQEIGIPGVLRGYQNPAEMRVTGEHGFRVDNPPHIQRGVEVLPGSHQPGQLRTGEGQQSFLPPPFRLICWNRQHE